MKKLLLILPALMLIMVACDQGSRIMDPNQEQEKAIEPRGITGSADHVSIPNQFIVTLESKANPADVAEEFGVTPKYTYNTIMKGFAGEISEAARNGLMQDNRVVRIEQDGIVTTASTTQENATWGLDRIDQRELPLDANYVYAADGTGVDAYIIDTGINYTHEEFQGRVSTNYYFDAFDDGQWQ